MSRAYNVVDADGHILEPLDLWNNYIDPKFRDRAPRIEKMNNGKERLVIEEHAVGDGQRGIGRIGAVGARQGVVAGDTMEYKEAQASAASAPCTPRLPDMDADGIDAAFLYPSLYLFAEAPSMPPTSRRRPAAPTTAGLPITARPTRSACSASRCCRCNRSTSRSPRCASPKRSSASRAGF